MSTPVIALVLGTRPEAIKLVPVVRALKRASDRVRTIVISTGQHRQMLDQILRPFRISVDHEMSLMEPDQTLYSLSSRALLAFEQALAQPRPDLLVVQGDTSTAFIGALSAYYAKIPVAHVEAGLRTSTPWMPFPEEINRRLISRIAELHFAPTRSNRDTLLAESVPPAQVHVTGNTGIDTLHAAVELSRAQPLCVDLAGRRLVLVTAHRRESFGEPMREIFAALKSIAERRPDVLIVFPVHLNPNVRGPAHQALGGITNVLLIEPLDYLPFVRLMADAYLILSDSGGVQEEAPALGVPVLVMREETERTEAVAAGLVRMVGTSRQRIEDEVDGLLDHPDQRAAACRASPFGDGRAAERIAAHLLTRLGVGDSSAAPPDFTG